MNRKNTVKRQDLISVLQRRMSYGGRKGDRAFRRITSPFPSVVKNRVISYWRMLRKLAIKYPNREDIITSDIRKILRREADKTARNYIANPYADQ